MPEAIPRMHDLRSPHDPKIRRRTGADLAEDVVTRWSAWTSLPNLRASRVRQAGAAAAGEASGTAAVAVDQAVSAVAVSPAADTLLVGDTLRLSAVATDANGHAVEEAEFAWESGDAAVAAVDSTGLVRGIAEGAATISAVAGSTQGTAQITVSSPDRAALVAFYEQTGGPNWHYDTNWLTSAPLSRWRGIDTDEFGRVTRIDFHNDGLKGRVPPVLGDLSRLRELSILERGLRGEIPEELGDLSRLETLYLGDGLSGRLPQPSATLPA